MPRTKQGGLRRKKWVHMMKEAPFPVPISSSSGESAGPWSYYTGYIEGSAVVVKHSGDMEFLYKMGFFGKGTLSRSLPNFHERSHRARVKVPQKDGDQKVTPTVVVNKRSYLIHRRYKALADGRTKEYNEVVHHEEQQQGFVDSPDEEELDEDSSDDYPLISSIETGKVVAFKLLSAQNSAESGKDESATSGTASSDFTGPTHISAQVRSHLVAMLTEVSALSNEQITTFLRVPQDTKQLADKFKKMRSSEINMLQQIYAAQFPGRNFKKGEVITLDEDDSVSGNEKAQNCTDDAVVISDSDDSDGDTLKEKKCDNISSGRVGTEKAACKDSVLNESAVVGTSKKCLTDWASDDDSKFWEDEPASSEGDKKKQEDMEVDDKDLQNVVSGKQEEPVSSNLDQAASVKNIEVGDEAAKEDVGNTDIQKKKDADVKSTPGVVEELESEDHFEVNHQVINGVVDDIGRTDGIKQSLVSSINGNDITIPDGKKEQEEINDLNKKSLGNGSSDDKLDVKDVDSSDNNDSPEGKVQSNPGDVGSLDASCNVKDDDGDDEMLKTTSETSKECSLQADISSEMDNVKANIEETLLNSPEAAEDSKSDKKLVEKSLETESILSGDCEAANSTESSSAADTLEQSKDKVSKENSDDKEDSDNKDREDEEVSFKSNNLQVSETDEKLKYNTSDVGSTKLANQKPDSPTLFDSKQTENGLSVTKSATSVGNNGKVVANLDESVTHIDSENSNDSDDVICIESKSAEPNKLHNFLSQTVKKPTIPVVTKSVTFMSSITEEPTFVCASVGFQTWGPVLHFNFTGDSSHLPTVMSVSPNSTSVSDGSLSRNGKSQNPDVVYERIYPPIRTLIPNASSNGAVIKQRLRGIPCLNAAYGKVSQGTSQALSKNDSTPLKENLKELPDSKAPPTQLTLNSGVLKHQHSTMSSAQKTLQLGTLDKPPPLTSSQNSSNPPKLKPSHVTSYMTAYQPVDTPNVSDHTAGKLCGSSSLKVTLSAVVSKLEQLYLAASKNAAAEKRAIRKAETDNFLSKFHLALSHYLPSIEISCTEESHLLDLLLSKKENHSEILNDILLKTKNNLSNFQTWLLEKRFERNQELKKSQEDKAIVVDLTESSENKVNVSQSLSDVEIEMIVDVDLADNSTSKSQNSAAQIKNSISINENLNEDCRENEHGLEETLKHSQNRLETENRKRKFDRSGETSEMGGKAVKLSDDEPLTVNDIDGEKQFNNSRLKHQTLSKEEEEDMLVDKDVDGETKNINASETLDENFTSNETKSDIVNNESCVFEDTTGVYNELKSEQKSTISDSSQIKSEDGSCVPEIDNQCNNETLSVQESSGFLKDTKSISEMDNKELVPSLEVEDVKMVASCTSASPPTSLQQMEQNSSDKLTTDGKTSLTGIQPSSSSGEDSSTKTIEDKGGIANIEEVLDSDYKHTCSPKAAKNISTDNILSNVSATDNETENLSKHGEPPSSNHLGKDEIELDMALDTSESQRGKAPESSGLCQNADLDSEKDVNSSTSNSVSKLSGNSESVGKGKPQNTSSSEDFQIFIGSSSDEKEEEYYPKRKQNEPKSGVHPYSAGDDAEGDLFVVPNTSDEDYEDSDDGENRDTKKQRLLWRPCVKRDPYATEEKLHLMLEEAFFLSFGLSCLRIFDPEMKLLNLTQMWQQFQVLKEQFIPHYVAYHYFRSKGWVPKSGLKFGCDLILYRDGPPFYHGSYSVVVTVVKDTTLLPVHRNGAISFDHRKLNWISLAGLNRITEHVAKELMLCYIIWPGDMTHEESLSPDCISRFKVKEVVVSRWVSSQERESRQGEEEIP